MPDTQFLTPEEAREYLEAWHRRDAGIRAAAPPHHAEVYARLFPGVNDETFRRVMERALLGELPDPRSLPPLCECELCRDGGDCGGEDIDWSQCPEVESVPGRCGGAWVVKHSRVMVAGILDEAEECCADDLACMFELPVEQVRGILAFAGAAR